MASQKISQLPAASTSSGSDLYPLVQGGVNKSITFTALQTALVPSVNAITALTGDVSATGPGSASAIVNSVGGQSASSISSAVLSVSSATNLNTASTLVKRDSSGNFSAGTITASLNGTASGNLVPVQNQLIVQKTPGNGQFSSVNAALAAITDASPTNPYAILIGPGVYTESQIQIKSNVHIIGSVDNSTILTPSNPNQAFVLGAPDALICNLTIDGATGNNGVGLFFQNNSFNITQFKILNCAFGDNTTLIKVAGSSTGPITAIYAEGITVENSSFVTGIDVETSFAGVSVFDIQVLSISTVASSFAPTDFIKVSGAGAAFLGQNVLFVGGYPTQVGTGIHVLNGGSVNLLSSNFTDMATGIFSENVGSPPTINAVGFCILTSTNDVVVSHPGTTGTINGTFSATNSTISSGMSVFSSDPNDGVTFTGSLKYGTNFSTKTDITDLILQGPTMGLYSGGTLSVGGGFVLNVSSGTGYFQKNAPSTNFFSWNATSITLSANSSDYIYFTNNGVLTASPNFPNTEINLLLGRVVTNSSTIEFIDASPLSASYYGNLNDNFIRNALGSVFAFGCAVLENSTPLHLDSTSGSYYFGNNNFLPLANSNITYQAFHQDGFGGWTIASTNTVDVNHYDDGSGTLAAVPSGHFARHTFYVVGDGANQKYFFVYSQTTYATLFAAQAGNIPTPPPYFKDGVVLLASIIVAQGSSGIISGGGQIIDDRPRIGFAVPAVNAVGTVTSVALTAPSSVFGVSGSPITSSGTLNLSFNTQSANTALMGPTSGSAAAPSFRVLASADLPPINLASSANGGVTGILPNSNTTATASNTPNDIVSRDGSGNFSAGTVNANLVGNVTGNVTGNVSGSAGSFTGSLGGDVTGVQSATVVSFVGGQTASAINTSALATQAATALNVASTLVKRDSGGSFTATTVTSNLIGNVTGNVTGNVSGSSASFTGSLAGDVTGTQGATSILSSVVTSKLLTGYSVGANTPILASDSILSAFQKVQGQLNATSSSAITALTGDVSASGPGSSAATVNSVGGSSAANIHSAELAANAATNLNTASTIVKRDGSGNFSAGTITANLTGNASGSASSFTGSLAGDVTGTQGVTVVSKIQGTTVSGTTGSTNVVFSTSPTLTGTITAAAANFSSNVAVNSSSATAFLVGSNVLTVDTVNSAVGINTAPSSISVLDVVNNSGSPKAIQATGYGSNVGFRGRYANGTLLSPTAAINTNVLSFFSGRGYGSTAFASAATGLVNIAAAGTFTDISMPTYISFSVTPTASVTNAEAMRIAPTGNLLVGTTTDNATDKLQVSGSATISSNSNLGTSVSAKTTIGAPSSTAVHQLNGGLQKTNNTIASSTYSVDSTTTDYIIYTDSTSNAITITLPVPTAGRELIIQDKTGQSGNFAVTIRQHASETINGTSSILINNAYSGYVITSDGTNWVAIPAGGAAIAFAFGTGADGNVTISSGTTTLTRDMYYQNLTINGTGKIATANFKIFVSEVLNLTGAALGAISNNGASGGAGNATATGGTAGAVNIAATLGVNTAGIVGGAGGTAAGTQSAASVASSPGQGGASGAGGAGGTGTGGAGAALRAGTSPLAGAPFNRFAFDLIRGVSFFQSGTGAPGGSGGGGDGTAGGGGGGGGAGGGIVYIAANLVKTSGAAASAIQAVGGNGGSGGSPAAGTRGAGGGGAGAGGGWIYFVYGTKIDAAVTNLLDVSGGASGSGGTGTNGANSGGASGGGGAGGRIDLFNMSYGSGTETFGGVATTGNPASGSTPSGGSGVAGQATLVNF